MSRLIDADALVAKYGNWYTEEGSEEGFIGTIKSLVDTIPTIEPERIQKDTTEYTHNEWVEYFMKRYWLSRQSAEDIMTVIPIIAKLKRDEEKKGEQE